MGRYEEALAAYDKANKINPKDVNTWANKGVTLSKMGRYEKASVAFDKASEINPFYMTTT